MTAIANDTTASLTPDGQGGELVQGLANQAAAVRKAAKKVARERSGRLYQSTKTRKSALTRERILEAGARLIEEHGGTDFQMSEVASRCSMSKGALYYYFCDRDAIVEEIFSRGIDEFVGTLERAVADARSSREALYNLCVAFGECVRDGGPVVVAMASELVQGGSNVLPKIEARFTRITQLVEVQLERAKGEGVIRPDVDPSLAASCICGTFFFAAIKKMGQADGTFDVQSFTDELMEFVIRGVGADS